MSGPSGVVAVSGLFLVFDGLLVVGQGGVGPTTAFVDVAELVVDDGAVGDRLGG